MITFNDILRKEGVDPKLVRLVRHQDAGRQTSAMTLYKAWKMDPGRLERYQEIQRRRVFEPGQILASFVVTPHPHNTALFCGLYSVDAVSAAPTGTTDPVFGHDVSGMYQYTLTPDARLATYVGRLHIDWGAGTRSWKQLAKKQDKPVLEIRDEQEDPFPGFDALRVNVEEFDRIPPGWVEVLKTIKGVYLLVDRETGKQYVGSAKGAESIWQRWNQYAHDGHGGNREMRKIGKRPYQMSVLQAMPVITPDQSIEDVESQWKQKLLTRTFGLNAN
jgi:hypothetical protein